jgi:CMP-N,N'-diacetyllegionaminic acid synthase
VYRRHCQISELRTRAARALPHFRRPVDGVRLCLGKLKLKVLALIPARGGSVTLPRKNVLPFGGKPLIAHSIEVARAAREAGAPIDRIIVSTDDVEIADVSRHFGAEVPFMRPAELARPDTASLPVAQHAVRNAEQAGNRRYDWVLLLQPTSPLRTRQDVCGALDIVGQSDPTAVVSVTNANNTHPAKLKLLEDGVLKPYLGNSLQQPARQDFAFDVYKTNGAIYLTQRNVLMDEGSFYGSRPRGLVMPPERSIDIDTRLDFELAEFLWRRNTNSSSAAMRNLAPGVKEPT